MFPIRTRAISCFNRNISMLIRQWFAFWKEFVIYRQAPLSLNMQNTLCSNDGNPGSKL